jgi:hypothetical protein
LSPVQKLADPDAISIDNGALTRLGPKVEKQGAMTMKLLQAGLIFTLASVAVWAQVNAGEQQPEASQPFTMTTVSTFELPWRLVFLSDGRMLITERPPCSAAVPKANQCRRRK